METVGIDHVALNVRDLAASLDFYTRVLGLKVSPREHQKPGTEHFLDCGSSLIGLIQGDAAGETHALKDGGLGGNHVAFRVRVKDFDRTVAELKGKGVRFSFEKKRERSWSAYFEDPDGNKLEITAWPLEG